MNTLRDLNPIAAMQWDYEKNGDMTPDNVPYKSGKEAHFICSKNPEHKWKIKIYQRTKANGENIDCPYCGGRLALPGETDFLTLCEQAKTFWDYENNEGLNPSTLLPVSTKRVNFICPNGHKFKREIQNFYKSPKCQECYRLENNLTKTHPVIADMWDYDKNAPDRPENHLKTDSTKVYWRCKKCDYSWKSEIASRTASKGLCPRCEGKSVFTPGLNDLEKTHPEILKYWDYDKNVVKPNEVSFYDSSDFYWKCSVCNYEWSGKASSRIKFIKGKKQIVGCKACARKVALKKVSDISTTHPNIASEFIKDMNAMLITEILSGTNTPVYWKCSVCNQIFSAKPASRTRYHDNKLHGCPFCSGKRPIKGINDFQTMYPDLTKEWNYNKNELLPNEYTPSSNKDVFWSCDKNHEWTASINTRTKGFGKCSVCTRLTNGNSLKDLHPELLEYWDYDLNENGPEYYTEFSNKSVYWKCHHGHSYEHPIYKYSQFGFYCVICDNRVLVEGINDLASSYPEILNIWDIDNNDVRPNEIFYSPQNSYYYKCDKGHTWYNRLARVVETDFTCDYCSNRKILPEFNSFKALHHDIANEWNYEKNDTTPDKIFPENTQYRIWTCSTCGMEFSATTRGRVDGSEYCSYCANKKATPGKNSFAALYPELLKEFSQMNDFNPDMVFPESSLYTIWDCHKYDMQWKAPIRDVVNGNRECPYCSGQNVVPGHTSLKALHKELALEYFEENDIDCDNMLPTYSQRVMWKCQTYGLIYWATVRGMVDGLESCPYCSERKAVPGVNSLKKLFPTIADELHDERYDADYIFPTLAVRVKWKCKIYGLEYNATVRGMVNGSEVCPYCSEKKAVPGETSLKALYSDMVDSEWNYLSNALLGDPDNILPDSAKSFFWKCQKCGYVYISSPRDRIRDKLRYMESCSSCKGLRQNFIHY